MVFTCIRCNTKFEAKRKSLICPNCKIQKCIICGKEFELKHPYTQKTCSSKCRGIYRKESGIAKSSRIKAEETFKSKYDDLGKSRYTLEAKKCAYCGNDFIPNSPRQVYCDNDHYGPCPVCGKPVKISDMSVGPQCCSKSCIQIQTRKTNKSKYGTEFYFQSDDFSKKSKDTNRIKYGYESYQSTPEFKQQYNYTIKSKYGVSAPIQFPEFKEKSKTTCNQKYGTDWAMQSEVVKDKVRTTAAKHGGFTYQRPELVQKLQLTNFAKYGDTCPVRTKHIQAKIQDTNLKKYGTKYVLCKGSPTYKYHQNTTEACQSAGIQLLHIFGYQWTNKRDIVLSMIRNVLHKNQNRVFARNTEIHGVSSKEASKFLDSNHIQGHTTATVRLGLYLENKLISIMTFSKPRFTSGFKTSYDDNTWELTRFCTCQNTTCVGELVSYLNISYNVINLLWSYLFQTDHYRKLV